MMKPKTKQVLQSAAQVLVDRMIEEFAEGLESGIDGELDGHEGDLTQVSAGEVAAFMVKALREEIGKQHDEIMGSIQFAQEELWFEPPDEGTPPCPRCGK